MYADGYIDPNKILSYDACYLLFIVESFLPTQRA